MCFLRNGALQGEDASASHEADAKQGSANLVQLGGVGKKPASLREILRGGPIVDKFFAAGGVGMFLGGAGIGAHLWLVLSGVMPPPSTYTTWRTFHATIQFLLFFGLFIAGFLLQAGVKIFHAPKRAHPAVLIMIPSLYLGVMLGVYPSLRLVGALFCTAPFIGATYTVFSYVRSAPPLLRRSGILALFSLLSFAAAPFVNIDSAANGLAIYWAAITSATFVASGQFIVAFLGGAPVYESRLLFSLYWLSLAALISASLNLLPWEVAGVVSFGAILTEVLFSRMYRALRRALTEPLPFAFLFGSLWALLGSGLLVVERASLDRTLHLWTLGWGSTILFAVSLQIVQSLSGSSFLKQRTVLFTLFLWQVAVAGRGLPFSFVPSAAGARMVNTVTTIVVLIWLSVIVRASWRITRGQWTLRRGESLLQC